jgi:hypothetical protein
LIVLILGGIGRAAEVTDAGLNARSLGMAGTFITLNNDPASGIFGNTATCASLQTAEVTSMYSDLTGDVGYTVLGSSIPTARGQFTIGFAGNSSSGIPSTSLDANARVTQIDSFNYYNNLFVLGYTEKISEQLACGLKLKYFQNGSSGRIGSGINFDLGFLYTLNKEFSLGLQIKNAMRNSLGAIKWANGAEESMPAGFDFGIGAIKDSLKIMLDYNEETSEPSKLKLGTEFELNKDLNLRLGIARYSLPDENYHNYSIGLGWAANLMKFDYAYEYNGLLSYNSRHYFSFSMLMPNFSLKAARTD